MEVQTALNIKEIHKNRRTLQAMGRPKRAISYSINTHIRDLTEEQLKEYAKSQEMSITDTLNSSVWYCQANNIDLAIWTITERRKANQTEI